MFLLENNLPPAKFGRTFLRVTAVGWRGTWNGAGCRVTHCIFEWFFFVSEYGYFKTSYLGVLRFRHKSVLISYGQGDRKIDTVKLKFCQVFVAVFKEMEGLKVSHYMFLCFKLFKFNLGFRLVS